LSIDLSKTGIVVSNKTSSKTSGSFAVKLTLFSVGAPALRFLGVSRAYGCKYYVDY